MKRHVPDLHTDFIYSVGAEEYGLIFSPAADLAVRLRGDPRPLSRHEAVRPLRAGARPPASSCWWASRRSSTWPVNLNMIPTKGMTLPFITYGGSSMLAMGLTHGHGAGADPPPAGRLHADRRPRQGRRLRLRRLRHAQDRRRRRRGHRRPPVPRPGAGRGPDRARLGHRPGLGRARPPASPQDFPAERRIGLSAATFRRGDPIGMVRRRLRHRCAA